MTPDPQVHERFSGPSGNGESVKILLASSRDWFASALKAVLEPEGFTFVQARAGEAALEELSSAGADLVIVDEGLPDMVTPALCRRVLDGPGGSSLPILVYSPNFWQETEQAEAMRAGAWDIIREPVRSVLLVAKLRRLLRIRELIESAEQGSVPDLGGGIFSFAGLVSVLPVLGSLAQRNQVPMSCVFFGPTRLAEASRAERQREGAARLCSSYTRGSDLCAFVGESDMVLVAYDADVSEATLIIRRLDDAAGTVANAEPLSPISAGIVGLSPSEFVRARGEYRAPITVPAQPHLSDQIAGLSRFAAAQSALRQAREEGGGIRIAEVA